MRHFIFVDPTTETAISPGRVVGFAEGENAREALQALLSETCPFLLIEDVDALMAYELASPFQHGGLSVEAFRREHPDLVAEIRQENKA